jgi:hypothetical protein
MQMWDNQAAEPTEPPAAHSHAGEMMLLATVTEGITQEHLQEVYADPYIARVSHDHSPAEPILHSTATYLSAWVGNVFAGAFLAIRFSPVELELHALLKKSALPHSRELGQKFLEWAFSHSILRVTTHIIEGLETAKNFCLKLGFKEEGRLRHACVQGGIIKDVYCLGMLREEWSTK